MVRFAAALLAIAAAAPAEAEVVARSEAGFVVRHVAEVSASVEEAWQALAEPKSWWNGEHTFSGDAANLSLEPLPGGCFCETLPSEGDKDRTDARGGVEHMRVVFVDRHKALRLAGALGPLQSEALDGTLTIMLKPADAGTRLTWEYVVGGFMRYKPEQIAPAVDKVIGEQLTRLAAKLGPRAVPNERSTEPEPKPAMESGR